MAFSFYALGGVSFTAFFGGVLHRCCLLLFLAGGRSGSCPLENLFEALAKSGGTCWRIWNVQAHPFVCAFHDGEIAGLEGRDKAEPY